MTLAPQKLHLDRNLHILFGVTLIVVMGVSSIAPAFPSIMEAFGLSATKVAWLVTAFTLPGVFLTPVFGILADRHGRKKVLVPALICFSVFGVACTLADSFAVLVGLRFLQGVGAASLGALNMTIISDLYSGNQRTQALGYNAGMLSLGTTLFPLLGGLLAQIGWRWPFILPLLALPLALIVLFRLDCPEPDRGVDFLVYMRLALKRATSPRALALFATTAMTFVILYGVLITFLPVYLAETFGAEPWAIGMIFASTSLATAVMSTQLGRLARKVPPSRLLVAAFVLYALSAALIPLMPGLWWVMLPVMVFGVAQALNIPCVQTLLAELAPMEQRGAFMALNGTVLRVGQTLGPVVMGTAYAIGGYPGVFMTGAVLALGVCVLVLATLREA
ncbi:MAG: MFS transporter [Proteobacteria bacterium]|nr:MFS transporter [Pseudomonadota bacterium]